MHCKAGRGRSTTVVLCYLIKHKGMAPLEALAMVRGKRPQIHLAQARPMSTPKCCAAYVILLLVKNCVCLFAHVERYRKHLQP